MNSKNKEKVSLIGLDMNALKDFMVEYGEKSFRAKQIFNWIYKKKINNLDLMTNLSRNLISKLKIDFDIHPLKLINNSPSISESTNKFLFQTSKGKLIESVLMKGSNRLTLCISSQVGCAVDCYFCATGKMGFIDNLNEGEIVDQFIQVQSLLNSPITNVVFMGMGEPFLNYKRVISAANLLNNSDGINLGYKRITISTAGIIPKIIQYSEENHKYKLAISLNATTEDQRQRIMPITKKHTLKDLLSAIKVYSINSKTTPTIEYVLIKGINDHEKDAIKLVKLLNDVRCKVNLIPYNEISGEYKRPDEIAIKIFYEKLKSASFSTTIRWSNGVDIDAGCGQLAIKQIQNENL